LTNKAYKFRIYPDDTQAALINRTFGCVRFVWNLMLQEAKRVVDNYKWFSVPADQVDVWRAWAHDNRVRYHLAAKPE
jgi:transposase